MVKSRCMWKRIKVPLSSIEIMAEELHNEKEFYQDNGWPTEEYSLCGYVLPVLEEDAKESDYDQFALITNAVYPYIRLTKKRGNSHIPCGCALSPATDGWFASRPEKERDKWCPKIAWGFAAVFLANLNYDFGQKDYVSLKDNGELIRGYYNKYLTMYLQCHNGLKYKSLTLEQKELNFIEEHAVLVKALWEKSEALKAYTVLYEYAYDAEVDYEEFLQKRREAIVNMMEGNAVFPITKDMKEQRIINQNGNKSVYVGNNTGTIIIGSDMPDRYAFSTEIRETFGKPYIKVFFLDDTIAEQAKTVVEALNCIKNVNITVSSSCAHPGNSLTVYPKQMVGARSCEEEVKQSLHSFFSGVTKEEMHPKNEAFFEGIEQKILDALNKAEATIDVCVAWFTNPQLRDKLLEKSKEDVVVRVIIYKDGVNHTKGVDLSGLNHKEYRGERGGVLHDKFCVIDNVHTINGSYNWTLNAEHKNDEDATFHFEDYMLASSYTKRFNKMWKRDEEL